MYNTFTIHRISPEDYLDKVFTYLPANAFIHKGRCGVGGTTLELRNKNRCSIIVAPTIGILIDKVKSHPDLFIVYEKVDQLEIEEQLSKRVPGQKIMTTPEGMRKIMDAAAALRMTQDILHNWFLLLDECHTFVSEDFRKGILRPFDYFWLFKNKTIISATPYHFSDPRMKQLDYHEIQFTGDLGTVKLVDCKSVFGTLHKVLTDKHPGNLHIFLNSVTEIVKVVQRMKDAGSNASISIYCADDKDKENMEKLGDLKCHYVEQPDKSNFSQVNFYTSRYFEGWDMFDDTATIILATLIWFAILGFSLGVEAGNQVVLLPVYVVLKRLKSGYGESGKFKSILVFQRYASGGIGLAGLYYFWFSLFT